MESDSILLKNKQFLKEKKLDNKPGNNIKRA